MISEDNTTPNAIGKDGEAPPGSKSQACIPMVTQQLGRS
jgi:hypothetical protein